jgi:hypothetical protein
MQDMRLESGSADLSVNFPCPTNFSLSLSWFPLRLRPVSVIDKLKFVGHFLSMFVSFIDSALKADPGDSGTALAVVKGRVPGDVEMRLTLKLRFDARSSLDNVLQPFRQLR